MICRLKSFRAEMVIDTSKACELDEYIPEVEEFETFLHCLKLNSLTAETQRLFLTALNAIQCANKAITQEDKAHGVE